MATIEALRAYGANVDDGLRRCMNMEAFYLRLVSSLKGDPGIAQLKAALEANDLDRTYQLAHERKGTYGNLSLTPILKPMSELSDLLKVHTRMDYGPLMDEILAQQKKLDEVL